VVSDGQRLDQGAEVGGEVALGQAVDALSHFGDGARELMPHDDRLPFGVVAVNEKVTRF